ncbi:hypothetical protein HBI56_108170 [Parastagonospora nodorum]|nr:hypothetical protein HBI95_232330 [Parastagonospora nodorum]KAH4303073.1 hypothetical protein HBI01_088030 [Parastagonospora nodorum]KAH4312267.1 hypothetical protein HBI02_091160 [Parastagonospora nodorum]KAH4331502.1 hypothetical protein HBI00_076390 [Parastagonospora nodorum]KAH4371431.1 hypothetical protein HBH94_113800 [Parastagonospora nodorum]
MPADTARSNTPPRVQSQPAVKEQPWKKWIDTNTDHGVEDPKPDVVYISADGAQPINLGG